MPCVRHTRFTLLSKNTETNESGHDVRHRAPLSYLPQTQNQSNGLRTNRLVKSKTCRSTFSARREVKRANETPKMHPDAPASATQKRQKPRTLPRSYVIPATQNSTVHVKKQPATMTSRMQARSVHCLHEAVPEDSGQSVLLEPLKTWSNHAALSAVVLEPPQKET